MSVVTAPAPRTSGEAARAVVRARAELMNVKDRWPLIRALQDRAADYCEKNSFAATIRKALEA